MPFPAKPQKSRSSIHTVEFGTGDRSIALGGEAVLPFYTFDGDLPQAPKVGIEITDGGTQAEPACIQTCYEGCRSAAEMAKRAEAFDGVDFLCLSLSGGDPNGADRPAAELADVVRKTAEAVSIPLMVSGCGNAGKDADILKAASEVLQGRHAIFLSATEETYESVGADVALLHGETIGAESAVDINLAKQLNILLIQLGVDPGKIVMNPGTAAAGYGFDYVISTIDRIRAAALSQDDETLQMPIVTSVAADCWSVKESTATIEEMPAWGEAERRGIEMETVTAAAVLACGSDAVIVRHPASAKTISRLIRELTGIKENRTK